MPDKDDFQPQSPFLTGLKGRCPRCGRGVLFKSFLGIAAKCNCCSLDLSFADSGDGPAVFVSLIGGFLVLGLALWTELTYEPPFWLHLIIFLPMTAIVCIGLLRPLKGVLISLQYQNKALEGKFPS